MGRRSVHSPDELRELILEAARAIIERDGIGGLSAREVARRIDYSPGTIYNTFENLDDVLLNVQLKLIERVVDCLRAVPLTDDARSNIDGLADAYVKFAVENRLTWNLLFAHCLPAGTPVPKTFHDNVNGVSAIIRAALAPAVPQLSAEQLDIAARALWAGVHGITAIAVTEKGPQMTPATAQLFAKQLTSTYLAGLVSKSQ